MNCMECGERSLKLSTPNAGELNASSKMAKFGHVSAIINGQKFNSSIMFSL